MLHQIGEVIRSAVYGSEATPGSIGTGGRRLKIPRTGRFSRVMPHMPRAAERIRPELRHLLEALAAGKARWPLYLYGPPGRGKTCAALWLMDQVPGSLFTTPERCVQWLLRREEAIWEECRNYVLAVVDELGCRSRDSDLEYVALKRLADALDGLPTIWIANHPPERIGTIYDERIYSRICCGTWFHLEGPDQRMDR